MRGDEMKNKVFYVVIAVLILGLIIPLTTTADAESTEVYLGGIPIGIGLAEKGLIVTGLVDVITDEGVRCPARGSDISTNDLIVAVDGELINGIGDFAQKIQRSKDETLTLTVKRGERERFVTLSPVTDSLTGLKKLGLTLKSGINGIGTLTFVTVNRKFGALGHGIVDVDTGKTFLADSGSIYRCNINGFKRATDNKAGELSGSFVDRTDPIGSIEKCNAFGVYGTMIGEDYGSLKRIPIASSKEVKTGDALIYSTITGNTPRAYKIEIVKTSNQRKPQEKSMLIRVTDQELLSQTGGILQGMSGSPIVQGGKLVGAVTHVLVNDSTLGYGLYLDWMLNNLA